MSPEPKPRSMAAVTITVLRSKETLALVKFGYLLEHPSISRYSSNFEQLDSDNPWSADNQQERPAREPSRAGILRDHTPNNCGQQLKRWSGLHGDMQEWRSDVTRSSLRRWVTTRAKFLVG
jgi:hypothetical protein